MTVDIFGRILMILLIAGYFLFLGEWIAALAAAYAAYWVLVFCSQLEGDG